LKAEDFFVVRRGPGVAACVALWDQGGFKQTIVHGYTGTMARLRPLINFAAPLVRMPRLPAAGEPLREVFLSHFAVEGDDPLLCRAIIDAALTEAHRRRFALALVGLAARHPLAPTLRGYRPREYKSLLHLVDWADKSEAMELPAPRIPHIEIAVL
jgi:hypothetical protein